MTMAAARKSVSIHDYPEHLNPFHEEDNHNKIRFWTIGRKLNRSNSISFSGLKDLKNSWALRSFMKKGKRSQEKSTSQANGESSPIVYRRAIQYSSNSSAAARSTVASPERYVYGGSVTPLPRSRFQERLRSSSQHEVNSISTTPRMARSEISGSRLSVESTNPFDDGPVPPVRASRRKKKRAPLPPSQSGGAADISANSENLELHISENNDKTLSTTEGEQDIEVPNLNIELKIVEDDDEKNKNTRVENVEVEPDVIETIVQPVHASSDPKENPESDNDVKSGDGTLHITNDPVRNTDSEEEILNKMSFHKVDIIKYRRNSSVNDDDIRLRRGNLEDFHSLTNKRSKSLINALDTSYVTYDINLNESVGNRDPNGNEEPQKVICKLYEDNSRKQSIDNSISSTEREFNEIDKATREFEMEISKLTSALTEDDIGLPGGRLSVSEIKRKFDQNDRTSPNPIPKPRRSHYGDLNTSVNGNF